MTEYFVNSLRKFKIIYKKWAHFGHILVTKPKDAVMRNHHNRSDG